MSQVESAPAVERVSIVFGVVLFIGVLAIGVGKEIGWIANLDAKRAIGAMFGLGAALAGNLWPKFSPAPSQIAGDPAALTASDRLAGRSLMLGGLAYTALWLFLPAGAVVLWTSVFGLFLFAALAGERMLAGVRARVRAFSARRSFLILMLHAIAWAFGIFLADAIGGDVASKWMVIIFTVVNTTLALWLFVVRPKL